MTTRQEAGGAASADGTLTAKRFIYKICSRVVWETAQQAGVFTGAGIDVADGYIHFSTAAQTSETARLHFHGQTGLVLLEVETAALGPALRYERSRDGVLFPHLYGALPASAVRQVWDLTVDATGAPLIPELSGDHGTD